MARRLEHPTPPTLHCLFLQGTIILPALQMTLPVSDDVARPLIKLIQTSEYPMVGVFPLSPTGQAQHQWGCGSSISSSPSNKGHSIHLTSPAARVIRCSRPATLYATPKPAFNLTLQGLTRIHFTESLPDQIPHSDTLAEFAVAYPSIDESIQTPSKETVHAFRGAALRLLDRLDLEPTPQSPSLNSRSIRPDVWRRLRSLVQDVNADGAVWLLVLSFI